MNWIDELKNHLKTTDLETLKHEWAELEKSTPQGPNAFEYIDYYCWYYSAKRYPCRISKIENLEKLTLNFSGSFFLPNIVA